MMKRMTFSITLRDDFDEAKCSAFGQQMRSMKHIVSVLPDAIPAPAYDPRRMLVTCNNNPADVQRMLKSMPDIKTVQPDFN
ncbi:hypothetical protein [Micavibrio aeruginosavorus]|uniref:hypothetical protein n=1 Tax=Micavibrio aeruginosavorus TaxID=349221 RepID=UPI003F4AA346